MEWNEDTGLGLPLLSYMIMLRRHRNLVMKVSAMDAEVRVFADHNCKAACGCGCGCWADLTRHFVNLQDTASHGKCTGFEGK